MPTVDVTSLLTGRNPIRQSSSYTMPVLSPRHSSSATLTGSYRSTFSSSSVSRPYYGSSNVYSSPRINTYSERFTSKTYTTDEGKKLYSRHASITEDGITTRYREESREKSTRRDSINRESPRSRDRDLSASRSDNLSTLSMIESVADLRNKYSPANYVPAVLRKQDTIARSKSINDIGRPPLEMKSKTSSKKVINENGVNCNGVALTNTTNNIGTTDRNGNRATVAEIRKKFDPNYRKNTSTNPLIIEGKTIHIKQTETESNLTTPHDIKRIDINTESLIGGNKLFSRPPKCVKTNDLDLQDTQSTKSCSPDNISNSSSSKSSEKPDDESASMDISDAPKTNNHTTNFASYIPTKNFEENAKEEEETPMNETEDLEMENTETIPQYTFQQNRILTGNNDISTSPRLNRIQSSSNSLSLSPGSRASPPSALRDREESSGPTSGRSLGLNGLKNIGNTCFMNSVVQCLSNTRYLLEYVKGDEYMNEINTSISSMKGALIKAFSQVISELWSSDSQDRVVNTVALKSQIQRFAPRFMGYAQQDAQEFLRYLLEGLHEDVNRVKAKPAPILTEIDEKLSDAQKASESWHRYLRMDNSRVVDTFVGQLKSTLRCTHCGHASVTFDPFWDLSLPIPQRQGPLRLAQCLEHFTREETLDGDEKPTCSKCKERRKCTKSFSIQKFPRVLVIHLKRFSPTERFRGKLNVVIDFPLQGLDLSSFAAGAATDSLYNLYAISNHSGTTYSGHYTAYCKHPYQGQWHEYNDSRVSSISPKNVVSSEAYVLFYELVGQHPHL